MFSATVPTGVQNIARAFLRPGYGFLDLVKDLTKKTAQTIQHLAINCPWQNRDAALADILTCYGGGQTIIFCGQKKEANQIKLSDKVKKDIEVIHGEIGQREREIALEKFRQGKCRVLVATDAASRVVDFPGVDLVI